MTVAGVGCTVFPSREQKSTETGPKSARRVGLRVNHVAYARRVGMAATSLAVDLRYGAGGVIWMSASRSVALMSTRIVAWRAPSRMSAASPLTLPAIRPIWPSTKTQ
jgi:hypothetical protein